MKLKGDQMKLFFCALSIVALLAWSTMASAATLVIDDGSVSGYRGHLLGATGVDVGGSLYDVTFYDGSCSGYYINCNPANFTFHDKASADLASAALLAQVFKDGAQGNFDTLPDLTFGCNQNCNAYTAYATVAPNFQNSDVKTSYAYNASVESADAVGSLTFYATAFLQQQNNMVFAVWSPQETGTTVSAVPEPTESAMMVMGLGVLALLRRKSARKTHQV
jgi:hypothetical protein